MALDVRAAVDAEKTCLANVPFIVQASQKYITFFFIIS